VRGPDTPPGNFSTSSPAHRAGSGRAVARRRPTSRTRCAALGPTTLCPSRITASVRFALLREGNSDGLRAVRDFRPLLAPAMQLAVLELVHGALYFVGHFRGVARCVVKFVGHYLWCFAFFAFFVLAR